MPSRQRKPPTDAATTPSRHTRGQIVVIDQAPLRNAAVADCRKAMAQVETARARWSRFEREDQPAFTRWRAREFGAQLSQLRELEAQVREHELLIHEVELEMRHCAGNGAAAYRRVLFRRANPGVFKQTTPDPEEVEDEEDDGADFTEFEKEALFQEWVRKFLGTNPDKLDDRAYARSFAAFKFHMFGAEGEPPPSGASEARRSSGRAEPPPAAAASVGSRLKELYRLLVRRLHPDLRADGNAAVSTLWHDVQEAYAAGDTGRLETLIALCDIEANTFGEQTTLSQMRAVLIELRRSLRALQRSLRAARSDPAWGFVRTGATKALRLLVQRELEGEFRVQTGRLEYCAALIAEWAGERRTPTRGRSSAGHPEFAF